MITSIHNDRLKTVRRLQRKRDGRFVAEGEDLLAAADAAGWTPVDRLVEGVDVEAGLLGKVIALGSGTRALAVYEERWAPQTQAPCVALWGVRDPGNVGTVLRSAVAFGAASVAVGPGTADPFGPRAVRASMGAIFTVAVTRVGSVDELPSPRVALVSDPASSAGPLRGEMATVVIGAERDGLPDDVVAGCERVARIPIAGDSLNAAMAATVALYEANRA